MTVDNLLEAAAVSGISHCGKSSGDEFPFFASGTAGSEDEDGVVKRRGLESELARCDNGTWNRASMVITRAATIVRRVPCLSGKNDGSCTYISLQKAPSWG